MAQSNVNEAAWTMTRSVRETNQAIADSTVAAQERNVKFAQNVFDNGIELLKSHTESARALMQEVVEQPQKVQGTYQAIVNSTVAAQERNMKFAQSIFENWIDLLRTQTETTRALMQTIVQHSQEQQEAYRTLARESVDAYADFLRAPLPYYSQAIDETHSAAQKGINNLEKAGQKATK